MSQARCPYDNSPMESFYGTFKAEFISKHRFLSDEELNNATIEYVYVYYNHIRPHSSNEYMAPFEKRTQVCKFRFRHQIVVRPLEKVILCHDTHADILTARLVDCHADGINIVDAVKQLRSRKQGRVL